MDTLLDRRVAITVVVVWTIYGIVSLATHTFLPVDETRYVTVAWNMWLRGDFLVPWLNDIPYHHKPPLLFWIMHAGWAVTGVNEWWPRIAPGLFGLGATWLTWRISLRLWPDDRKGARLAVILLVGSLWWSLFAAATMFDMLIAFFTALGMLGILVASEGNLARGMLLVGAGLGFGLLAKGPTILLQILPAGLLAPWWLGGRPQFSWKRWYGGLLLAVLLGAMLVLAWAIPAAVRGGPEYTRMIFWGQTADRMVQSFAHQAPGWWYLAMAPAIVFPWFFWPPLWSALRHGLSRIDAGLRFAVAWAVPVFIAFSFISGKQAHYLLPILPACALFGGRLLSQSTDVSSRRGQLLPALVSIVSGLGVSLAHLVAPRLLAARWVEDVSWLGGFGLITWGIVILIPRRPRIELAAGLVAGVSVVAVNTGDIVALRTAGPAYDQRALARYLRDLEVRGVPVAHLGKYHGQYQFLGRLERTPEIIGVERVGSWFEDHPDGRIIAYFRTMPGAARPEYFQDFAGRRVAVFDRSGWSGTEGGAGAETGGGPTSGD